MRACILCVFLALLPVAAATEENPLVFASDILRNVGYQGIAHRTDATRINPNIVVDFMG